MTNQPNRGVGIWAFLGAIALVGAIPFQTFAQGPMMGQGQMPGMNAPAGFGQAKKGVKVKRPASTFQNKGISKFTIAAVVDDEVILLEDIVASIRPELEVRRKAMPPAQYKEYETQRVQQAVKNRIQQTIILNELKKKLPDESRLDRLRGFAEADFEKYLNRIAQQNNMKSRDELLEQLRREGADLSAIKSNFIDMVLAQQFLQSMVQPKLREPTREEMEEYYSENIDKYSQQAGAVWRHIEVKKGSDPNGAKQTAMKLRGEVASGADFAEVAKKSSQGPTKAAGGLWSRTSKGSYADPKVDEAIFSVPVNQVSDVIEGKNSFHVIRVEERNDGNPTPFIEVQEEIRMSLKQAQMQKLRETALATMQEGHHIVTAFEENSARQAAEKDKQSLVR